MQEAKTDRCPYCNQTITHTELQRIEDRIKTELDSKMKAAEAEARAKLQAEQKSIDEAKNALERREIEVAQLKKNVEQDKQSYKEKLKREADDHLAKETEKIQKEFQNKQKDLIEEGRKAGRLEGDAEKRTLQKTVEELKRQLEKKTADELGSLSEEELAKRLGDVFREDKISRIPKGEQGADVRHEIIHRGLPCGLIIYESKNRKDWQNSYIDRAKEYKTMYQTQSVILVSITFPSGEQNFCIKDGIVVVHPSIVIPVVQIIRGTILKLHLQNLSQQEIATKMNEVYKYISGDEFKVQLDSIFHNISDLQKIQKDEQRAHQNVWTKQTTLFDALQKSAFTIQNRIDNIIQSTD